jgi:hypothetical protein
MEQNLIIVTTANPEPYMTATLVAKADPAEVSRVMAMPGHHTMLFSMAGASPISGEWLPNYKNKAFRLVRYSSRKPYLQMEGLETLLRVWWLGAAPESIDENIEAINQMMSTLKEQALTVQRLSAQMPRGPLQKGDEDGPADLLEETHGTQG